MMSEKQDAGAHKAQSGRPNESGALRRHSDRGDGKGSNVHDMAAWGEVYPGQVALQSPKSGDLSRALARADRRPNPVLAGTQIII